MTMSSWSWLGNRYTFLAGGSTNGYESGARAEVWAWTGEEWRLAGNSREARYYHAVSAVDWSVIQLYCTA